MHNEEHHDLSSSQNIRAIKSWRMRWAGQKYRGKDKCIKGFDGET
jgi:hypothetical protein